MKFSLQFAEKLKTFREEGIKVDVIVFKAAI